MKEQLFGEEMMGFGVGIKDCLPKRLEILNEGFANREDASQVNQKLIENECETLYARSFFEASLIYALDHKMGYARWKELFEECQKIYDESSVEDSVFKGGKITLKQLESYIQKESDGMLQTEYLTKWLESGIKEQKDPEGMLTFMKENMEKFSTAREKARYYFSKYLYYYIVEKCENYYKSCQYTETVRLQYGGALKGESRGMREKFALEELTFLKPLTKLKKEADKIKPGMTPEEKTEYLQETSLTPGGIFDEFNYFYFGYVSADWLEVLFELYGEFSEWPHQTKIRIARSLGLCSGAAKKEEENQAVIELEKMAKEQKEKEEAQDETFAGEEKKKSYQRGRSGEDYFREFLLGKKDINRSTLISFLLFVNSRIELEEDNRITIPRLNRILLNCGFVQLRPDRSFDKFVMAFLKSKDPMDILEEEVEKQVVQGNDFYLYRVYKDAYCHQNELLKYLV